MELVIYLLGILLLPLLLFLRLFNLKKLNSDKNSRLRATDKSFSNIAQLKILEKKILIILYLILVIICSDVIDSFRTSQFGLIVSVIIIYLILTIVRESDDIY